MSARNRGLILGMGRHMGRPLRFVFGLAGFMIWKIRGQEVSLDRTFLMGILNVTPDSFSDGGKFLDSDAAVRQAVRLEQDGADFLDLGAESTRPNAPSISADEELRRILPVLKGIHGKIQIPVSIDTTKPEVARACFEAGAHIVNDVSGLKSSGVAIAKVVKDFGAGLILMHRRGDPSTMQSLANYGDVVGEVLAELKQSLEMGLAAGILREQMVVDPGLGFAKTTEQNLGIIRNLEKFHDLGCPVLLGPSRKSFIGSVTGRDVGQREFGTAAVVTMAVIKKIQILRVHEVRAMRDVIRMAEALEGENHVGS